MADFKVYLGGENKEALAKELADFVEKEFGTRPSKSMCQPKADTRIEPSTLELLMILIALPPALDAAANLKNRVKNSEKIEKILNWIRRKKEENPKTKIDLSNFDGKVLDLNDCKKAKQEMLEALDSKNDESA